MTDQPGELSPNCTLSVGDKFRTNDGHRLAWSWPDEFTIAEKLEPDHLAPDVPKVRLDPSEPTDATLTRGVDDIHHALKLNVLSYLGGESEK